VGCAHRTYGAISMSEDDLLSQEEKDALIKGVESGDVDTDQTDIGSSEARAFNFASRELRLLDSLPRLQTVSELFVEASSDAIGKMFRADPAIESNPLTTRAQQDFIESMSSLCHVAVCTMSPLEGRWILALETRLLYILVDRYFGGKGLAPSANRNKQFTPIEQRLARQVTDLLLTELALAFEDVAVLEPAIESIEENPEHLTLPVSHEPVIQLSLNIGFVEDAGLCHIVLPYAMFETIKDKLNLAGETKAPKYNDEWQPKIRQGLRRATLKVTAELDELNLTLRQILDLVPGDVLPIKSPDNVTVKAEGEVLFFGKFGTTEGHNAVKITQSVFE